VGYILADSHLKEGNGKKGGLEQEKKKRNSSPRNKKGKSVGSLEGVELKGLSSNNRWKTLCDTREERERAWVGNGGSIPWGDKETIGK